MKNKILIGLLLTATIFAASCGDKNFSVINSEKITQEEGGLKINYSLGDLVRIGKYKGIDLHKKEVIIDDKQITSKMMSLAGEFKNKKFTADENETVGNGDIVNIDFEGFVDGSDKSLDSTTAKDFVLGIGSGAFIAGFEEQLIGHKVGEPKFDINVKFPDDYGEASMAGKPARFEIKINGVVRDKDIADNNDKTKSQTMAEWKEAVKADLVKETDERAKSTLATEAMSQIAKLSQVRRFPEDLIEKYKQIRIDELYKPYAEQIGTSLEDLREEQGLTDEVLAQEAQNDLFKDMIIIGIAKKEKLNVTAEELKAKKDNMIGEGKQFADEKAYDESNMDELLVNSILYEKVMDFVVENANIITVNEEAYNELLKGGAVEESEEEDMELEEDEVAAEEVDDVETESKSEN